MQKVSCPGCGAEVTFRSSASVMAVCEYCHTTILKDADSVRNLGKMAEVIEDYSPLQIGTAGNWQGQSFTVIGRIQLRYEAGFWNEWYVLMDGGQGAWLSDASGQYTFTVESAPPVRAPDFAQIRPGMALSPGGEFKEAYTASDVRSARCTGGQGELPFKVGAGWEARVADFRSGRLFLTLDYSDGPQPKAYAGKAVTLAELKCQLLRSDDQIKDSAGRYKGKIGKLDCPSCGAPITASVGITSHAVCPSCHSEIDLTGPKAEVLAVGKRISETRTTLELGAVAQIDGATYTILGLMRRRDVADNVGDDGAWTEYLLYAPGKPFLWLVETKEEWERAEVLNEWPNRATEEAVSWSGATYRRLYDYRARVVFALGSFNWRVSAGDTVRVLEYKAASSKLAAEMDEHEITWSRSVPVSTTAIRTWFGRAVEEKSKPAERTYRRTAVKAIVWLAIINLVPFTVDDDGPAILYTLAGAAAIWIPAWLLDVVSG
jgi:hypothetical protein